MTKEKVLRLLIPVAVIVYIILGRFLLTDYGISRDERAERESLLVNMNYISGLVTGQTDESVTPLFEYKDRYYGMAAQFPMAIFERVFDADMRHLFLARHFYTFLFCILGYLCFYLFTSKIFKSRALGVLGTLMVALYPRFFAEQFYNIKDMVFMSLYMINFYVIYRLIENGYRWRNCLLFILVAAVSVNVRIMGAIFPVMVLGYMWIFGIRQKREDGENSLSVKKALGQTGAMILGIILMLVVLTPVTWHDPFKQMVNMFKTFLNYGRWNGTIVFMGEILTKEQLPWYYVPVWLLISLPVWYLILAVASVILFMIALSASIRKKKNFFDIVDGNRYVIMASAAGFLPWLSVAITHATIYNGWRHLYFVMPSLVVVLLWTIKRLFSLSKGVRIAAAVLVLTGLLTQTVWICKYHPYEYVYLNEIGSLFGDSFDRDYWTLSEFQAYERIRDVNPELTGRDYFWMGSQGAGYFEWLLKDDENAKVAVRAEDYDYFVAFYRGIIGNEFAVDDFTEIDAITVNGFKIASIYIRNDLLDQ